MCSPRFFSRMACTAVLLLCFSSALSSCAKDNAGPVHPAEHSAATHSPGGNGQPPARGRTARSPAQEDVQAVVLRIIDGDSLVVAIPGFPPVVGESITVRVASCNTPELSDKRPEARSLALAAKAYTEQMAPPGSTVWLRDIRRDKYFRLLARVEAGGVDVTEALIRNGLAMPYEGGKKTPFP